MTRAKIIIAGISILLLMSASLAFAAKEPPSRIVDPQVYRVMQYAFPYPADPPYVTPGAERAQEAQQLGVSDASASPGAAIGVTWYDYQHNGRVGRMNETRTGTSTLAHFTWMYLFGRSADLSRGIVYDNYNLSLQAFGTEVKLQPDDQRAGYVAMDVTNDNRAVIGCHVTSLVDALNDATVYWDFAEGASFFGVSAVVPSAISSYGGLPDQEVIWPSIAYSEGASDTVLHVFAQNSLPDAGDPQAIYYFRRVGSDADVAAAWDNPPRVVDTVFDITQTVEANDDGKVVLVWVANIPCSESDPDTASCNTGLAPVQWNNDLYYQISENYGSTWHPRVNLTHSNQYGAVEHYKPYADVGVLIDLAGNAHIVWGAAYWDGLGGVFFRNRILHWSENQPYIRTAHAADWNQTTCNGGAWALNASKMSISECNGRLYCLFSQFNDGQLGVFDDCANDGNPGFPAGGANGELYVVVSEDGGLTWDQARNLTNSRTPGCDSVDGEGGPCESDMWPTMARYGTDVALASGDNVTEVVVPAGGADNGWYLDVQYINDHSAGAIVNDEGTWQQSDVRWFRMACAAAITAPNPAWNPISISFPAWTKMNRPYNRNVVIENLGNANYTYAVTDVEDPSVPAGISAGWLTYSNFDGSVPFGLNNTETGTVTITPAGGNPLGIYTLSGRLIFTGNNSSSPDTFEIDFVVADTLYPPEVDTVHTAVLALVGNNSGAIGEQGDNKVNMDYVQNGADCDTLAQVYLFSGSPVVAYVSGADTVANFSAFGNSYATPVGFFPITNSESFDTAGCEAYKSVQLTRDSSLAIQTTIFAPKAPAAADSNNFIIKRLRVWPKIGTPTNISIGEVIDWDVPSDSGSNNGSDVNATEKMLWQYGGEYHQDDTGANASCQDNDARFGGVKFLSMKKGATDLSASAPVNAYTADNATWIYNNDDGFVPAEIFTQMETKAGFSKYESTHPDSVYTDLHTVMTFTNNMNFAANDTVTIWMALITVKNGTATDFAAGAAKAKKWYENHLAGAGPIDCVMRGDMQCDNKVIVSDLTYLVNFLFKGGPVPCKVKHGDVNCDNKTIVSDLTYLVNFLFKGGPVPCACS